MKPTRTALLLCLACLPAAIPGVLHAQPAARPVPTGTVVHRDLAYVPAGHERHTLDLFLPEKGDGPFPLVVWIHGGGWAAGSKAANSALGAGLIERGYAVASLNYRLSGHAIFPAQIEDCKAAIRWLRAHAAQYRLDVQHFGVWGSSAGGHLSALVGTSGDVPEFDVGENRELSSRVQAVCDYFGPTDFLQMNAHNGPGGRLDHDAATSPESRLIGGPIQDPGNRAKVQRANPLTYVTPDDPPFFIVHGDADPLVPHHQSRLLYDALRQAGVPVRFTTVVGGGHGRGFPERELHPLVREFFDRHLKGDASAARWPDAMTSEMQAFETEATANPPAGGAARPGGTARPGGSQGRPAFDQILSREDANGDGKIGAQEFRGPGALFARLDRNGDNLLTREEYEQGRPGGAPRSPQPAAPAPVLPVWRAGAVASKDNTALAYVLVEPTGNGRFPVLLYLHGAPGGIGEAGLRRLADSARWARFVKEGFAVCLADYRGHPPQQPFSILSGETDAADDVAAIVRDLAGQPKLDAGRLVLLGGSLGGAVALHAASTGKVAPAALVLNAPASHAFLGARSTPASPDATVADADFDRPGALLRAERIPCPVLIVQGTADPLTPLNRMLDEVFRAAGKDCRLELFPEQGHGFTNGPDNEHYRRALDLTLALARRLTTPK